MKTNTLEKFDQIFPSLISQTNNNNNNQSLTSDKSSQIAMTTPIQSDNDENKSQLLDSTSLRNTLTKVRDSKVIIKNTNVNFNQEVICPNFRLPFFCYNKYPRACCPGLGVISALLFPSSLLPAVDYIAYAVDSDIETSTHHMIMAFTALVSTAISACLLYKFINISETSKGKAIGCMIGRIALTPILIYVLDILLNINDNNYDKKPDWQLWVMTTVLTLSNASSTVIPYHKKFQLFPRIQTLNIDGKNEYHAISESHSISDVKRLEIKEETRRINHAKEVDAETKRINYAKEVDAETKRINYAKEVDAETKRIAMALDMHQKGVITLTDNQLKKLLNVSDDN